MNRFRRDRSQGARQRVGLRAVFAIALLIFLVLGIVLVGDFAAQWWLLILPVALLVGPVLTVARKGGRSAERGWDNPPAE